MRGHERPDGWVPEVAGILTADQLIATGHSIAAAQQADGAIGWPDGHVDAWNHVECAMALSACGLRGPARRAYAWLAATQRPDGSWPVQTADGSVPDLAAESNHAVYPAVGVWHEFLVTGRRGVRRADVAVSTGGHRLRARPAGARRRDHLAPPRRRHAPMTTRC